MIETTQLDGIRTIRLAHGKASAMDVELLEALRAEFRAARNDRALIVTGTDSIFCAGVDLVRLTTDGATYAQRFFPVLNGFMRELFELPIPVIAALNGHAIAGGALIAMASDYRLMARGKGRFGVPELKVGVRFPRVPLEIVRFAVPREKIQRLVYRAETLTPEDTLGWGLVDELCEPDTLMSRALEVATQLAQVPAENFAAAKRVLREETVRRMDEAGADSETASSWAASETHERIRDYLQKLKR